MAAPLELRVKPVDSPWETVGVDRYAGIEVEGFTADADAGGPATCSFTLKRPAGVGVGFPDLAAFTDCEVWIAGRLVWEGRIREAPTSADPDEVAVAGVGWQAHEDDDQYQATYVETDLGRWRDVRSLLTSDLTKYRSAPALEVGEGGIVLTFPTGFTAAVGDAVGAIIDLGPDPRQWVKRVSLLVEHTGNGSGSVELRCVGHDTEAQAYGGGGASENAFAGALTNTLSAPTGVATTGTTKAGTFANGYHRFVTVLLFVTGGGAFAVDQGVKVKAALLAREAAYEAAGASTLKASTVYADALDQCCPLLSSDRSLIQATTYSLPEYTPDGPQTARAVRDAVNAPHRWRTRIRPGRVPEFAPQPNAPLVAVGDWGASKFRDASAGSGDEVVNRALVTGTGPDGNPLLVERISGHQPGARNIEAPAASGSFGPIVAPGTTVASTSGGSRLGGVYRCVLTSLNVNTQCVIRFRFVTTLAGVIADSVDVLLAFPNPAGGAIPAPIELILHATRPNDGFGQALDVVSVTGSLTANYVLGGKWRGNTLVDRRGFVKARTLPIEASLTTALGNTLGDVYVATYGRTPLKGGLEVGVGGVRRIGAQAAATPTASPVVSAGGDNVHPSELLMMTTDLVRLSNLVDPDTGAGHRDAVMATVTYTHADESSSIAVDNDRSAIDALLTRVAAVRR